MERADREIWAKRVERWKDSGLSAKEFAAEIGVKPSTLSWWKWQLGTKAEAPKARARRARTQKTAFSPMTFVEMAPQARPEPLEIVWPSGVRIRVPVDVDPSALARIIDVVEKSR
jgi:transposase